MYNKKKAFIILTAAAGIIKLKQNPIWLISELQTKIMFMLHPIKDFNVKPRACELRNYLWLIRPTLLDKIIC